MSPVGAELERSKRIFRMIVFAVARFRRGTGSRRVLFNNVNVHLFEKRGVAVGQANLQGAGIVPVFVYGPGRSVPNIVLFVADGLAIDFGLATALDAEINLRRIVPDGPGAFAGFQHGKRNGGYTRRTSSTSPAPLCRPRPTAALCPPG